jgi:hypothetical protein
MRYRLLALTLVASLAAIPFGVASRVVAQTSRTAPAAQDADMQAIQNNVLTVKGMKFPKLSQANAKTNGQSCCNVGDTRSHDVINFYQETQGVKPSGKVTYQGTTPYSPPLTCWVISSYGLTDRSMRGASRHLSAAPAGYNFVTSNQYQQTYEDLKNFVMNMNILDKYKIEILANLKEFTNNYAAYSQSLSVSHGSVLLYVELTSQGKFNGRSWYEGVVNASETCCPPEIKDPLALKMALTNWVNDTIDKLPNKGKGRIIRSLDIKSLSTATPLEGIRVNSEPTPTPTPVKEGRPRP